MDKSERIILPVITKQTFADRCEVLTKVGAVERALEARLCARYSCFTIQLDVLQRRTVSPRIVRSLEMVLTNPTTSSPSTSTQPKVIVLESAVMDEELSPLLLH
jgi:hypothetical protein